MSEYFYVSLQFSAIQSTINRYDRLWSIAGISRILQILNEVKLPYLSEKVLVAGGGKFTARFDSYEKAEKFRKESVKLISTSLPMLEFQISDIISAENFEKAKDADIISLLKNKKSALRGYALTFNPHFRLCEECGVYPAEIKDYFADNKKIYICRICEAAKNSVFAKTVKKQNIESENIPSIDRVYSKFFSELFNGKLDSDKISKLIPKEFENLFPSNKGNNSEEESNRMAVWFSDLNSMKDKVTLWLSQVEDEIYNTFKQVKEVIIEIISDSLKKTFKNSIEKIKKEIEKGNRSFLPFRIIVAGGDDLCIVMDEKYIVDFAINLSETFKEILNKKEEENNPISKKWLDERLEDLKIKAKDPNKLKNFEKIELKPLTFGSSFIICHFKTPFKRIYDYGEELMKESKIKSDREYNCVNWRIYIGDEVKDEFKFEKPLPILKDDLEQSGEKWSLEDYTNFIGKNKKNLTNSQIYQIVQNFITYENNYEELLKVFIRNYCKETENLYKVLINEKYFFDFKKKEIKTDRILTLFELARIYEGNPVEKEDKEKNNE